MALPTDFPTWASDTNYSSGPDNGQPTKVVPTSGDQASGFVALTAANPRKFNWLLNNAAQWFAYLKALPSRSEFLSSTFAWTAQHTFTLDVNYNAAKTFARFLPLISAQVTGGAPADVYFQGGTVGVQSFWKWSSGVSAEIVVDLDLPTGAVLTGMTALFSQSGGTNTGLSVALATWAVNASTGAIGSVTQMRAATATPGATGAVVVSVPVAGGASQAIDRSTNQYALLVAADTTSSLATIKLNGLWVQYTMPGYRNG
jgi:hypothetical protein